jgi:outer membrane protein OmpA-like peptidoglycan-associated protein
MRKELLLLSSAVALLLVAAPANAHANGWYIGIAGGGSWVENSAVNHTSGVPTHVDDTNDWDTGWIAAASMGYRWPSNWRLELELAYRSNDGAYIADTAASIELTEFTQMLNAFYDIPLTSRMTLSLGAGLGGDMVSYSNANTGGFPLAVDDDDYVLAGQLIAQLGFAITSRVELYADYRYLVTDTPVFSLTAFPTESYSFEVDKHAATIGLRYDLSPDEEPLPPPPPPPPPPTMMSQFVVFFGFNKCNLSEQADGVVTEAAATARAQGAARISVVGHTDTVGSDRYNQKLSECRANTVKGALVSKGIPEGGISAIGHGETALLVQTGDGVKEPQNRRATIDLR